LHRREDYDGQRDTPEFKDEAVKLIAERGYCFNKISVRTPMRKGANRQKF